MEDRIPDPMSFRSPGWPRPTGPSVGVGQRLSLFTEDFYLDSFLRGVLIFDVFIRRDFGFQSGLVGGIWNLVPSDVTSFRQKEWCYRKSFLLIFLFSYVTSVFSRLGKHVVWLSGTVNTGSLSGLKLGQGRRKGEFRVQGGPLTLRRLHTCFTYNFYVRGILHDEYS